MKKGKAVVQLRMLRPACCQPAAGNASSCCTPGEASWKKGKTLVSVIIIMAAIGVGANSFLSGNSAQSYTTVPAKSFSAGLTEIPAVTAENSSQGKPQTKQEEISLNRVLDSLQSLDTLAADKDVVFLVLPGEAQISSPAVPKQLGTVANNLWKSGRKVGSVHAQEQCPRPHPIGESLLSQDFSLCGSSRAARQPHRLWQVTSLKPVCIMRLSWHQSRSAVRSKHALLPTSKQCVLLPEVMEFNDARMVCRDFEVVHFFPGGLPCCFYARNSRIRHLLLQLAGSWSHCWIFGYCRT